MKHKANKKNIYKNVIRKNKNNKLKRKNIVNIFCNK